MVITGRFSIIGGTCPGCPQSLRLCVYVLVHLPVPLCMCVCHCLSHCVCACAFACLSVCASLRIRVCIRTLCTYARGGDLGGLGDGPPKNLRWGDGPCIGPPNI